MVLRPREVHTSDVTAAVSELKTVLACLHITPLEFEDNRKSAQLCWSDSGALGTLHSTNSRAAGACRSFASAYTSRQRSPWRHCGPEVVPMALIVLARAYHQDS